MSDNSQIRSTMSFARSITIFIKGYIKNPVQIVLERDWLLRKRYKPWYPDDWLFNPQDYLDGVDEGLFGKISALECWLYHFDKGNLQTRIPRASDRPAFAAMLKQYQQTR